MASKQIEIVNIPGFPEFTPREDLIMHDIGSKICNIYKMYGFGPLDTRVVEERSILEQKGIEGKELFSVGNISDGQDVESRRDLVLRFDLTVPLARYVAQNKYDLQFPYKRFAVGKVYRAETAKDAKGRFNEFYQYDIDVIGRDTLDLNYDSEFPAIIYQIFKDVIGIKNFIIRINNRQLLEGLFMENGITDIKKIKKAVKVIDNIEKVDESVTITNLQTIGITLENAINILELFRKVYDMIPTDAVTYLKSCEFKNSKLKLGIQELETVVNGVMANGVNSDNFRVDIRIARGLDYYTGTGTSQAWRFTPPCGSIRKKASGSIGLKKIGMPGSAAALATAEAHSASERVKGVRSYCI